MDPKLEQQIKIKQSARVKELMKSDDFKELLTILALKIKELDTVRDINNKDSDRKMAVNQLARKMAIDIIEQWLDEILGVANFNEFIDNNIEKTNDIIGRF